MDRIIANMQKSLQKELDAFRLCQKEYHRVITQRQHLDAQLNENTCVKNELDLLKEDGEVYKLIGPVLIKQELDDSKQHVAKRIEYITGELKRLDLLIAELDKKEEKHRENLTIMQKNLQEATLEAAIKKA